MQFNKNQNWFKEKRFGMFVHWGLYSIPAIHEQYWQRGNIETADIYGAGELTKFWRITFPMSKPILAVIALSAFTLSYGGFMWAFLTC